MSSPGVPAAEAGPRPDCKCHGEPMWWTMRHDMRAGGLWRCRHVGREARVRWLAVNRPKRDAYLRDWRKSTVEYRRAYQRQWRYGITPEEYEALWEKQEGKCAICSVPAAEAAKNCLHIDHDHSTGRVRGLLCLRCNSSLERLEQDGWMERARFYLEAHR